MVKKIYHYFYLLLKGAFKALIIKYFAFWGKASLLEVRGFFCMMLPFLILDYFYFIKTLNSEESFLTHFKMYTTYFLYFDPLMLNQVDPLLIFLLPYLCLVQRRFHTLGRHFFVFYLWIYIFAKPVLNFFLGIYIFGVGGDCPRLTTIYYGINILFFIFIITLSLYLFFTKTSYEQHKREN